MTAELAVEVAAVLASFLVNFGNIVDVRRRVCPLVTLAEKYFDYVVEVPLIEPLVLSPQFEVETAAEREDLQYSGKVGIAVD